MKPYHQRRPAQRLDDELQRGVIRRCQHLTLAMARDGEPYLCTVNYGYDEAQRCFFFHCSPAGKKADFLRANPLVWGQILEDLGYRAGRCQHAFQTVQFRGRVSFVEDATAKRAALELMIEQLEPDPEPVKARFIDDDALAAVAIGRIAVESFSAKRGKVDD